SSTCYDLKDFRADFKHTLEELGYAVWASEYPDFPVDSALHNHDNCLINVERADLYLLIINDRYGSTYVGELYPQYLGKGLSITRWEYLRALEAGKDILILVRQEIWDRLPVLQEARKMSREMADQLAQAVNIPVGLLDLLEYIISQKRRNWIHTFAVLPD